MECAASNNLLEIAFLSTSIFWHVNIHADFFDPGCAASPRLQGSNSGFSSLQGATVTDIIKIAIAALGALRKQPFVLDQYYHFSRCNFFLTFFMFINLNKLFETYQSPVIVLPFRRIVQILIQTTYSSVSSYRLSRQYNLVWLLDNGNYINC